MSWRLRMEVERIGERAERGDPTWPAQLAVATAIALNLVLTEQVTIGPPWLLPVLEGVLLVALFRLAPSRLDAQHPGRRRLSLGLTGLISLADVVSLALLVHYLVAGGHTNGHRLIASGAALWATNVLLFAVWFWELDGGGPVVRFARPRAQGLPVPADGEPDAGASRLAARLRGLPLPVADQRDGVQPDGHDAADARPSS